MSQKKAKREIEELDTMEVSLVNRAANGRTFLVFKEADEPEEQITATETDEGVTMNDEILNSVLKADLEGEAEIDKLLKEAEMSEKGIEAAKSTLKILAAFKEDLPEGIVRKLAALAGYEEPPAPPQEPQKQEEIKKEDLLASVPKEYKAQVEKLWKQSEETAKKADDLARDLAEERNLRKTAEFVEKADQEFKFLPTKAEDFGPILKAIDEKLPEHKEELHRLFKAASEAIEKSKSMERVGSPGTNANNDSSALGKLQGIAKELVTKGDASNEADAFVLAIDRNPALYEEYIKEQRRS